MSSVADVLKAREDARRARARFADDIALLQRRASPAAIAADAAQTARDAAVGAVELVKSRPLFAIGGLAAVGVALSARPLRRAAASAGAVVWRNRSAIGRLFIRTKAGRGRRDKD